MNGRTGVPPQDSNAHGADTDASERPTESRACPAPRDSVAQPAGATVPVLEDEEDDDEEYVPL